MRTIALLMILCGTSAAIDIPPESRVRNIGPRCTWAAIETLARARTIPRLLGLLDRRTKTTGSQEGFDTLVEAQLESDAVPFINERHGSFNRDTLDRYANSHGIVLSMKAGTIWVTRTPLWGPHSIALTKYSADSVQFYCPNNPSKLWTAPRSWFDAGWMGNAIVLLGDPAAETAHAAPAIIQRGER